MYDTCDIHTSIFNAVLYQLHIAYVTCPGSYLCKSDGLSEAPGMCIAMTSVCNGQQDCPLGDDEVECGKSMDDKTCSQVNETFILIIDSRGVHTSVVGHRPTTADIVARVEAMPTFVRRRPMHTDASMNAPLLWRCVWYHHSKLTPWWGRVTWLLNKTSGLRHQLSWTWDRAPRDIPRRLYQSRDPLPSSDQLPVEKYDGNVAVVKSISSISLNVSFIFTDWMIEK